MLNPLGYAIRTCLAWWNAGAAIAVFALVPVLFFLPSRLDCYEPKC